ncbi:MAG TPA: nucleotidyltransferase [Streptosporangiaceae bacterium]|nr:nucleotidyltransferase [Streptosporangiaceae bacterium]
MPIPDKQVGDWSLQADSTLPGWTHSVLHDALHHAKPLQGLGVEIFVQGSYANSTNVRKHSDVDLVAQLKLPLEEDVRRLSQPEVELFYQHYEKTDYGWEEFREDVLRSLREQFFVREGNKCIDITDMDSLLRVPADILPAIEFRRYSAFPSLAGEVYEEGVFFRDASGRAIVNFPKQHLANGKVKDKATGGRFKQVVRVYKNARRHETAHIEKDSAPSYFLECLLYNVPDRLFRASLSEAYLGCLGWLSEHRDKFGDFTCQNKLVGLFGSRQGQWSITSAENLISALNNQWEAWD